VKVGNRVVEIDGPAEFGGGRHAVMKGWDEALMYIMLAGMTHSEICVTDFSLEFIHSDVVYLRNAGLDVFEWGGNVYASGKNRTLRAIDLFTAPYPGVNSDMQPLFAAFASRCEGESTITDQRFTDRFQYVEQLKKLGMNIESYGNCAVIRGAGQLHGGRADATDLRCGAALVMAALVADGSTEIGNARQIFRGYEDVVRRLKRLGASLKIAEK
jgi:UDP-N-acetylglucosamine 1-carboxyvinyltransferase